MQLLGSCNLQTVVQHQLGTESRARGSHTQLLGRPQLRKNVLQGQHRAELGAAGGSHTQLSGRPQQNPDMGQARSPACTQ